MNPYLVIPILSGTACTALATWIFALSPGARANRRAALLVSGAGFWAVCEVLWNTASDPATALALVKLSCLGWVALGPLGLEVLHEISPGRVPAVRRALPPLYAAAAGFLALDLLTPWIHTGVVPTAWGWGYELGPLYLAFYPFTVVPLLWGLRVASRSLRTNASPAERSQAGWVMAGVAVPLVVASATDGLLPFLGIQVVHLATASFAFLAATVAWSFYRYGHALLAPSAFAAEVLETLPDGVALVYTDGRIRSANPGLAHLIGVPHRQLEDVVLSELVPGVDLDAPEGSVEECELETEQGAVPVSLAWRPLLDKRGLAFGRVVVLRDVRELVDLRRRLVTSGRLAAVGELAAGIAHEINNPIAFVGSNLVTLREYWADLAKRCDGPAELLRDGEELIEESLEGVERVSGIVRDVKGFAHPGREEFRAMGVNATLETVLRLMRPRLGPGIRIECCLGDVPQVMGSPRQLQQVMLNLLVNSIQAMGERGVLRLLTVRRARGVEIQVQDDGCGIPPENLDRVFDPFFTTKTPGEGTGLGLAISYQIVREHGGDLRLESEIGSGTRARVLLPLEAQATAPHGEDGTQTGSGADR